MIIGAGVEQVPAYQRAKNRGFNILGTDIDPNAPALEFADYFLQVSTKNAQETAFKAEEFDKKIKIDGVMTIANDVPHTVAMVANKLNLPAISIESALIASDKLLMKNTFKMNDVPCPWFSEVKSEEELRFFTSERENQKYVIKPTDGSGARGVLLIDENTDLSWAYKESKSWSLSGKIIIEKFEEGMQLSTESFILNNKCFTPALAERNYARLNQFKPYIIEDGGTIPAIVDKKLTEKISSLILDGAHAMGISKGVVKGDIVINKDGEPLIIELAARLSGGWLSTHQIPAATGVDLVNAVMSEALGIEVSEKELTTSKKKATAIRYFFPEKGKILSIEGLNELKNSHGVIKCGIFKNVGELQPEVQMHPDRFGYVLVEGSDRKNAIKLVKDAMSKLKIRIKK